VPVRHIVMFRVYDTASDDDVLEAIDLLRGLKDLPGILEWRVELSEDRRKGRVIIEDSVFENFEAIDRFRVAPEHAVSSAKLASMADWLVGDYVL
jgi:hypothetical protein